MRKRDKGNVTRLIMSLFSVMAIALVCIGCLTSIDIVNRKNPVDQISRAYMLRMETVGYLREEDRVDLLAALGGAGVRHISLSGTTLTPVGYGSKISLCISGELEYEKTVITDLFHAVFSKKVVAIHEKRESTAKN